MADITIAEYIVRRLEEQGVKSIFGSPGSYLANFLDAVENAKQVKWVGECNELNAAYAADGYARYKRSLAVLCTTVGVGELSAINGLAGSYAEELPVLQIVGQQPSSAQEKHESFIHTLGDGKYDAFAKSAQPYICSQYIINKVDMNMKPRNALVGEKIDQVIIDCISKSRPAYIAFPHDLAKEKISDSPLKTPLVKKDVDISPDAERAAIEHIDRRFDEAFSGALDNNVVVIADVSISRHDCIRQAREFLDATQLPVYGTPLGKTVVDETSKRYGGVYLGNLSSAAVKEKVEKAKLVLFIGPLSTDFNTGKFSYNIPEERSIKLHWDHTGVGYADYSQTGMKKLLPKLADRLSKYKQKASQLPVPKFENEKVTDTQGQGIRHKWFWPRIGAWFQEKDLIVTEAGSVSYGVLDLALPKDSSLLAQKLWASIGWSLGGTHGAALARRELGGPQGKTILFIGDGSLQMTVQELSNILRSDLKPIIFVIKNGGYTIERLQQSVNAEYHNIVTWDYQKLLEVLKDHAGNPLTTTKAYRVSKEDELAKLLDVEKIRDNDFIQLVEVVVPRDDAPPALLRALGIKEEDLMEDHGKHKQTRRVRLPAEGLELPSSVGIIGW